jgi:outer membrane protein TolC
VAVGIPAELLRRRPDVRKAEREVAAQSAMIGVAVSELYPHFAIDGTLYFDALRFEDLLKGDSLAGAVGPVFRWNILNYGRLVNNVRVQESRFQQLAVEYQNTVLSANAEAENALIGFLKAQQQAMYLAQSTAAAQESMDMVLSQYHEGVVDFNRVFNVQQFLTQQQDQLAVAQGSVAQNLIQLYRSLGGGWQIRFNPPMLQRLPPPGPPMGPPMGPPNEPLPAPIAAPPPAPLPPPSAQPQP